MHLLFMSAGSAYAANRIHCVAKEAGLGVVVPITHGPRDAGFLGSDDCVQQAVGINCIEQLVDIGCPSHCGLMVLLELQWSF